MTATQPRLLRSAGKLRLSFCVLCIGLAVGDSAAQDDKDNKKAEKPLLLHDLITRGATQRAELSKANKARNFAASKKLLEELNAERKSWMGKHVEGEAVVLAVIDGGGGSRGGWKLDCYLTINKKLASRFSLHAKDYDKNDPLFFTLKSKDKVEFRGILRNVGTLPDARDNFIFEECVITLKKT